MSLGVRFKKGSRVKKISVRKRLNENAHDLVIELEEDN